MSLQEHISLGGWLSSASDAGGSMTANPVDNVILTVDSYKASHYIQYPPGTSTLYSYFESRGGKFEQTVFFGLQYILKRWFIGPVITQEKVEEAKSFFQEHLNHDIFNEEGWMYIVNKHKGYLPLKIKAVPEGMVIPTHNALMTVENTDPKVPWLTNWFETLLVQVWYPLTVATNSWHHKEVLVRYLSETSDTTCGLPYQLHDFGYRGSTSVESAAIGGAAHLVNFKGTDNLAGVFLAKKYYNCPMAGYSVPATEHSTMTAWGKSNEVAACRHMLDNFPTGILSVVSDSYNVYNCCEHVWGHELKAEVIMRSENGGVLVIRLDSGDPPEVVVQTLETLGRKYGTTKNKKGYRVLPPYLKILQGDGITLEMLDAILANMKIQGWSAENIIFGSGGALLQKLNRDTQKCAFKCSMANVMGREINVFKNPITDSAKKSKKGRLALVYDPEIEKYVTIEEGKGNPNQDILVPVFENGRLLKEYTLDEIRQNAEKEFEILNKS